VAVRPQSNRILFDRRLFCDRGCDKPVEAAAHIAAIGLHREALLIASRAQPRPIAEDMLVARIDNGNKLTATATNPSFLPRMVAAA
jgi:hypothetical protein